MPRQRLTMAAFFWGDPDRIRISDPRSQQQQQQQQHFLFHPIIYKKS